MPESPDFDVKTARIRLSDGQGIALRRWGGSRPRRMVISHGNGLAIDGFFEFGRELLRDFEVVAFDMRNHGQSGPGPVLDDPWPRFILDLPEIFDAIQTAFGEKPTHGAFHSLSSIGALLAQGQDMRPWRSLTLYEPPVPPAPDPAFCERLRDLHAGLIARTRNRRRRFRDPEQLVASLRRAATFSGVSDAVFLRLARAMLRHTGTPDDTPWELICDPDMEANTFDTSRTRDYWDGIGTIRTPVQIVLGTRLGHDMPILIDTAGYLAREFGFDCARVEGGGHLMQLQRPRRSAEHAARFALAQHENTAA